MSYPAVSKLTTAPTTILGIAGTALITMQNARDALGKPDDVTEDRRIANLIPIAYNAVEQRLNRAIITQTRTATMANFGNMILLDYPPLVSVTSVKYYDTSNSQQTFSSAKYVVDVTPTFGTIQLQEGQSWPTVRGRTDAVEVIFVCGAAVGSINGEVNIREAILQELWGLFFKDDVTAEVMDLLNPYMVVAL